jgi:hypothetical protein
VIARNAGLGFEEKEEKQRWNREERGEKETREEHGVFGG